MHLTCQSQLRGVPRLNCLEAAGFGRSGRANQNDCRRLGANMSANCYFHGSPHGEGLDAGLAWQYLETYERDQFKG